MRLFLIKSTPQASESLPGMKIQRKQTKSILSHKMSREAFQISKMLTKQKLHTPKSEYNEMKGAPDKFNKLEMFSYHSL